MRRYSGRLIAAIAAAHAALCLWPAGGASAAEVDAAIVEWFAPLSLTPPSGGLIVVCHGFTCHSRTQVALTDADRVAMAALVRGANPEAERRGIAKAVAWFDKRVGKQTGTTGAKAFAKGLSGNPSQYDCIDRAANTTSLFLLMADWGLLKHHRVDAPVSRRFIPVLEGPHSTAVLREWTTGRRWAVDSWTRNFGEVPEVMPVERWLTLDSRHSVLEWTGRRIAGTGP